MKNRKSSYNIVMNESDLEKLDKSELIKLLLKQNAKPVKPKKVIREMKVKPKLNYNLEDLFDDDPFPDFKPVVTNDPFDKEMNKVRRMERKLNKMDETIENKYQSLQTGNVVITYPKIDVSMNKFRKEENPFTKTINKKGSSFFNLFEKRINKIPGEREKISIAINVDIWNGIITTSKTYGPFTMKITQLDRCDMYKFMVYAFLKNNFTLLSAEEIKSIGCQIITRNVNFFVKHNMGKLKLDSYFLSKQRPVKSRR